MTSKRFHTLPASRLAPDEIFAGMVRKNYPIVARQIEAQLQTLPESFTDYYLITGLLEAYCRLRQIPPASLQGYLPKMSKAMQHRREFLALMLLLYQPAKIYGYSQRNVVQGLLTHIAEVLQCPRKNLANLTSEVVVHFKQYPDFKANLLTLHAQILATN